MRKNEAPHKIVVDMKSKVDILGKCTCVAGLAGFCNHVIGLLFFLAHCKQMNLKELPDELTCTSMQQRWSVPRNNKIASIDVQDVLVKKPAIGADYNKYIKSTIYSPSMLYTQFSQETFAAILPEPLFKSILPMQCKMPSQSIPTKFGNVLKGCVLSYQQKFTNEYAINDFNAPPFPALPLHSAEDRFLNNLSLCLMESQHQALESLCDIDPQEIEERTISQGSNRLWHALRSQRITASKFGLVARRQSNFETLKKQLGAFKQTAHMRRGIELEERAATIYASECKRSRVNMYPAGLVINLKCPWLGCSPDRKIFDIETREFGLLEVKVVKEGETSFDNVQYLRKNGEAYNLKRTHTYYYQVQCQIALTGLLWCDFFSYISDDLFFCERIYFDGSFFQSAKDSVDIYFFSHFLLEQ